jgi:hypothetical protein
MACTIALDGEAHGLWRPNYLHQEAQCLSWRPNYVNLLGMMSPLKGELLCVFCNFKLKKGK